MDTVKNSQNSSGNFLKNAGRFIDELAQRPDERHAIIRNASVRRRVVNVNSQFAFNSSFTIVLPKVNYLGNAYLVLSLASSGNSKKYMPQCATQMIKSMKLTNGGRVAQEISAYHDVFSFVLDRLDDENLRQFKRVLGKNQASAQLVCIPLFFFWSKFLQRNFEDGGKPLHYSKLSANDSIQIEITTHPESRFCDGAMSNTGSLVVSANVVFEEYLTEASLESQHSKEQYVFCGIDFKSRENISCTANQDTEVDITQLQGQVKYYKVLARPDSNIASVDYLTQTNCSKMALNIDGRSAQNIENSEEEIILESLLKGQKQNSDGGGTNYLYLSLDNKHQFRGHLNTRSINDCRLTVQTGVNSKVSVLAVSDVCWKIQNGQLVKYE